MQTPKQFEYLASRLHEENQNIRKSARKKMREILKSPDSEKRLEIAKWAEGLEDTRAAAYILVRMLNDPDAMISHAAKIKLVQFGPVALDKLEEIKLNHPDRLKMRAVDAIGEIASVHQGEKMRALRLLVRFEQDSDPAVKAHINMALDLMSASMGKSRRELMLDAKAAFKTPRTTAYAKAVQLLRHGI